MGKVGLPVLPHSSGQCIPRLALPIAEVDFSQRAAGAVLHLAIGCDQQRLQRLRQLQAAPQGRAEELHARSLSPVHDLPMVDKSAGGLQRALRIGGDIGLPVADAFGHQGARMP
jgi:hypothetical protein